MKRRIMIITGSPRKNGNTAAVAEWVRQGAEKKGASVEMIDAAKLKYKSNGCIACDSCKNKTPFKCIIDDEASKILAKMQEMDVLVFATPVYLAGFSAQIKLLMDRMYSLVKFEPDKITSKLEKTVFALIATAGDGPEGGLDLTAECFDKIATAGFFSKRPVKLLVPKAPVELGEIRKDLELKDKSEAFGAKLATL